ncbi:hypothetical protein IE81DRAFT_339220 [Ceraceosorus guamensis]|uniref:Ino eighty subunit 1 n=1 Tax=Ceraceosorus guamensis TaxID=1522189 RepID=A0A316W6U9_9BASI|nr:hypothetical protein IE81DRAFT_339220 [Ceraceosorus guamensis]PWN45640.1 hypothetical protein IE81DRAFT_339220 [Ceraceosorus guamensis]
MTSEIMSPRNSAEPEHSSSRRGDAGAASPTDDVDRSNDADATHLHTQRGVKRSRDDEDQSDAGPVSARARGSASSEAGSGAADTADGATSEVKGATPVVHSSRDPNEDKVAPGSAPYWPGYMNSVFGKNGGPVPRNLPVKRYDGEPLTRADLQHAVLCHIFGDTQRVFTNPRPGTLDLEGQERPFVTPMFPYGMAPTCARPSDESAEEHEAYQTRLRAWQEASEGGDEERRKRGLPCPGDKLLTFKELYLEALLSSSRCTKTMRDKLLAEEEYAEDFGKVNLLVNVGRINTTLAFYPEMKTVLRSYHPLASLQKCENTRRNMQDAPRMKSLLKASLIETEKPGPAGTNNATAANALAKAASSSHPAQGEEIGEVASNFTELIAKRRRLTKYAARKQELGETREPIHPITSVINMVFLLLNHAPDITAMHFAAPHDLYTLFFPHGDYPVPARERARVFLWLVWHYLERHEYVPPDQQPPNPFDDDFSRKSAADAATAYAGLSKEEQDRISAEGLWRGIKNPAYDPASQRRDEQKVALASAQVALTAGKRDTVREQLRKAGVPLGAASKNVEKADPDAKESEVDEFPPSSTWEDALVPLPEEYLHRLLAPKLSVVSIAESAKENVDAQDEIDWALEVRQDRSAFLLKVQQEEQLKATGGLEYSMTEDYGRVESPMDTDPGTDAKGPRSSLPSRGGGKGLRGKPKGRVPNTTGGGSAYPLANILAAAKDQSLAHARRESTTPAQGTGDANANEPVGQSAASGPTGGTERAHVKGRTARQLPRPPHLWGLDLSVPAAPNGIARNRNMSSAAHFAAQAAALSLPRTSWRRILERARRGVGDASYESGDEAVYEEEAKDERPRGEISRILRCLRDTRTLRGQLQVPANYPYPKESDQAEDGQGLSSADPPFPSVLAVGRAQPAARASDEEMNADLGEDEDEEEEEEDEIIDDDDEL